ncbi:unnamed protein product [Heligmosomoides polygyrus]|uniref:MPN domain-containing protein n=1 Tax=Heligmosomoides polygyrus TaxID=6339 RepID=A0A183GV02_HELPZ|nr:unnamed protein product [Heligmosomoides polygyrus]
MDGYVNDAVLSKMNVAERMANLMALGKAQKVNNAVPIVRYYRSMIEAHRMALSHLKNQDVERALILLIRFCSFTIEELPKHVEFSKFDGEEKRSVMTLLKPALERAENLKKQLKVKYEAEAEEAKKIYDCQAALAVGFGAHFLASNEARRAQHNDVRNSVTANAPESSTNFIDIVPSTAAHPSERNSVLPTAPPIDRAAKPHTATHSYNDLSSPVEHRALIIAGDLVQKFLICADNNTARNIETCGTLCGTIVGRNFLVSHVILPKQSGASDGCSAEGEEEVFAYQNEHDLITLGWIHTHPSQTAFLSSVDLHTHCAYQMMLSEAVAIVCAPAHNQ